MLYTKELWLVFDARLIIRYIPRYLGYGVLVSDVIVYTHVVRLIEYVCVVVCVCDGGCITGVSVLAYVCSSGSVRHIG